MSYQQYIDALQANGYPPPNNFQQPIPNRSLVTNDIEGARSRKLHYFLDRHIANNVTHANQEQLISPRRVNNSVETNNAGRRRYWNDMLHVPHQIVPQGVDFFQRGGKKHYEVDDGEIKMYKALENRHDIPNPQSDEFDRALQTKDIDGAVPGTLISKVVKNKEVAQKLKQRSQINKYEHIQQDEHEQYQRYAQRAQQAQAPVLQQTGHTLVQDNQEPQHQKSLSQASPNPAYQPRQQMHQSSYFQESQQQPYAQPPPHLTQSAHHQTQNENQYREQLYAQLMRERQLNSQRMVQDEYTETGPEYPLQYPYAQALNDPQSQKYGLLPHQELPSQVFYNGPSQPRPQLTQQTFSQANIAHSTMRHEHQGHPQYQENHSQFFKNANQIMAPGNNYKLDIIGNYVTEKPHEFRVRTQDYEKSRQMVGFELKQKVPAAQHRPRPF